MALLARLLYVKTLMTKVTGKGERGRFLLNDRTITKVCKVIGGLSTDDFGLNFLAKFKGLCFVATFVGGGNSKLIVIKKYHGQTII